MIDVTNQITESEGRGKIFACTMLKGFLPSKQRGWNALSSYSHLSLVFLSILLLNMPLLLWATPSSNRSQNARPNSSVQCQRSLLGKKQDSQSFDNYGSSSLAPIIDELVEFNLSGRAQGPRD